MATRSSAPGTSRWFFPIDIENVPEEYRQVGTSILMENDKGQTRSFLVTHMDDETLTVDGNNPLCGREVVFTLEILTVRDATDEETRAGGAIHAGATIDPSRLRPVLSGSPHFTARKVTHERPQASPQPRFPTA